MKNIHSIRQLAVVAFLSMLTISVTGQQNTRQDRRNASERNSTRTETSQRSRSNSKARPSNEHSKPQKPETYNRNDGRTSYESKGNPNYKKNDHNYKKNDHYNKSKFDHKPSSAHVHHRASNRHAYYQHLPTKRVNRFHYNGYDYYHSNNHFYRFHPHHGYQIVEAPFTRVRYLPARYQVRVYNGYSYPYYNGYFFLPAEYGYVMVPAPARPQWSFNVVLNL